MLLINYSDIISWTILTFFTIIILSGLYRFATLKRDDDINFKSEKSEETPQKKFVFISADVYESIIILRSASEDTIEANYNKAVQKSNKAILLVLTQLLKYFVIENKNMDVGEMYQELLKQGITLNTNRDNFIKFNEIIRKDIDNKQISKDEAIWVLKFSGFIIENVKEVKID